jgi:hypothetical protein
MPRVAGVRTYQNLFSVLFILRSAREIELPDGSREKAMTVAQIHSALSHQGNVLETKTVNGYLKDLETQTPHQVECIFDPGNGPKYWRLAPNSPLNDNLISDFEAAMICLSSELLEPLLPPALREHLSITRDRARDILLHSGQIGVLPPNSPIWALKLINRVWVEKPPVLDGAIQEVVFAAVRTKKRLRLSYESSSNKREGLPPSDVTVSPVQLIQHGDARLYLVATGIENHTSIPLSQHKSSEQSYRRFALHRIKSAKILDEPSITSEQIQKKIDREPGFGWQGKVKLKALVHSGIALRLEESPLNETQTLSPSIEEDWFELNVEIDHNWELRWWVLSNGKFIIIQEPKQFRDEIADHFFIGSKQYT